MSHSRVYLDHAATGWPKEDQVYRAMDEHARSNGSAAGRGAYGSAIASGQVLAQCRSLAARTFHSDPAGFWILTTNGSAALNLAIHGLFPARFAPSTTSAAPHQAPPHVITTAAEHNSVLRPLHALRQRSAIELDIIPVDDQGRVAAPHVLEAIRANTRLIAINHACNVTGAVAPLADICEGVQQWSVDHASSQPLLLLLDAAQTAGQWPLDLRNLKIDLVAMPGHKGLGGPLGTGLLYVGPRAAPAIHPVFQGGTGAESDQWEMPMQLPERLEVGNCNVPAFAGLAVAMQMNQAKDLQQESRQNAHRVQALADRLASIPGVSLYCGGDLPILSLTVAGFSPQELANILDSEFGIETRAGLHCAPLVHQALGTHEPETHNSANRGHTLAQGGTLRASFCHATEQAWLDRFAAAIEEIAASNPSF